MKLDPLLVLRRSVEGAKKARKITSRPHRMRALYRVLEPFVLPKETSFNRDLRISFCKIQGSSMPTEALRAVTGYLDAYVDTYTRVLAAVDTDAPIVWHTWAVSPSFIRAFAVEPCSVESTSSPDNVLGADGFGWFCQAAEEHGVGREICSINKCAIGSFLLGQIPAPSLAIYGAFPCDGNRAGNIVFDHLAGVSSLHISAPHGRTPQDLDKWARTHWEMLDFLEKHLGRKPNWDILVTLAENINRTNRALDQIIQMQRNLPAPGVVPLLLLAWQMSIAGEGNPHLADMAEKGAAAARDKVAQLQKRRVKRERIRVVVADQTTAWTDNALWMRRRYGASVVMEYLGGVKHIDIDTSNKESLVRGIAQNRLNLSMTRQSHGPMEQNLEELLAMINDFSADCVIFNDGLGCKHNMAIRRELEDTCRSINVPALFIGVETADNRMVSEADVRRKIHEFMVKQGWA